MAVPTSWQESRNSILTTVSRKTALRRISFLIVAVSAPERHWIGFRVILPKLRTQHIVWARCGCQAVRGRQAVRSRQAVRGRQAVRIYR